MWQFGKRIILVLSMMLFSSILIADYTLAVSTDQPEYNAYEQIEITLTVTNTGDETLNLTFPCSPPNFYSVNGMYYPEIVLTIVTWLSLEQNAEHTYYSYIYNGLSVGEYTITAGLHFGYNVDVETEPIYISVNAVSNSLEVIPENLQLRNYPNPFNPVTSIYFNLVKSEEVHLEVYDMKGKKIKTLLNSVIDAGEHLVIWNGDHDDGSQAASGIYLYKLRSGRASSTKKMILMK